jgi:hypothetical protein
MENVMQRNHCIKVLDTTPCDTNLEIRIAASKPIKFLFQQDIVWRDIGINQGNLDNNKRNCQRRWIAIQLDASIDR